jgi:hypothetical protein
MSGHTTLHRQAVGHAQYLLGVREHLRAQSTSLCIILYDAQFSLLLISFLCTGLCPTKYPVYPCSLGPLLLCGAGGVSIIRRLIL